MNAPLQISDARALLPIEIDPRHCDWCGLTIDQHVMVDEGDGPEFFCQEIHPHAADLVRQWEAADPRDRWQHTGEAPPPAAKPALLYRSVARDGVASAVELQRTIDDFSRARAYRTPQSTIDAFWYVVRLDDPDYLARWLADHPRDSSHLLKIWKAKKC
jgi:hypothetical protein